MITFTLRQEHLDLLAKAETTSSVGGARTFWMPDLNQVAAAHAKELALDNRGDFAGVRSELWSALEIILSARGAAVPLGRYERKEGRWSLVEEME